MIKRLSYYVGVTSLVTILFAFCNAAAGQQVTRIQRDSRPIEPPKQSPKPSVAGRVKDLGTDSPQLVVQLGHKTIIQSVSLSPDAKLALMASVDGTASLWEPRSGKELRRFRGHKGPVLAATLSSNLTYVLTGGVDGTARLWDLNSGNEVGRIELKSKIDAVAFTLDERSVLLGGTDGSLGLFEINTRKQLRRFIGHVGRVTSITLSRNGQFLLSGGEDKTARLWDLTSGAEVRQFVGHRDSVDCVAFSPDGMFVLTGSKDGTARLWNISGATESMRFTDGLTNVTSVAFLPDSKRVLTASLNQQAMLWDIKTGKMLQRIEAMSPVMSGTVSLDGHFILLGELNGEGLLWDVEKAKEVTRLAGASNAVTAVTFSADQQFIVTASEDGVARLWDLDTGEIAKEFKGHVAPINAVAFSPDGKYVLTGSGGLFGLERDNTARLWEVRTGKEVNRFVGHRLAVKSVAFSPDGQWAITGGDDSSVRLWDIKTGNQIRQFDEIRGSTGLIMFGPDGKSVLLTISEGKELKAGLWEVGTGKVLKPLGIVAESGTLAFAFSPDLKYVLQANRGFAGISDGDNTVRLVEINSGQISKFEGHSGTVNSVAFSPDGKYILTGSADSTTRLWSISTGKEISKLVSFSSGTWAVIGGEGQFDTNAWEQLGSLQWVLPDDRLRAQPLELYIRDYYLPRLLPRLLRNDTPKISRPLPTLNRALPIVSITKIEPRPDDPSLISVTIEAVQGEYRSNKNPQSPPRKSGIFGLRIFRDGQLVNRLPKPVMSDSRAGLQAQRTEADDLATWRTASRLRPDPKTGRYVTTVEIRIPRDREGETEISAYAFNDDRVKSTTVQKTHKSIGTPDPARGRVYVITIGVAASENPRWDLFYPANDARTIGTYLKRRLSESNDYEQIISIPLISDYVGSARSDCGEGLPTREVIKGVIDLLAGRKVAEEVRRNIPCAAQLEQAQPEDLVFISFSGHGYGDAKGNYYLFPHDIGKTDANANLLSQQFLRGLVSTEDLSNWLADVNAKEIVLILDACQSETAAGVNFKPGPMGARGLGQLAYDKRMRLLAGTQADNQSIGVGTISHGLLSYALIEALEKASEAPLSLGDWLSGAIRRVPQLYEEKVSEDIRKLGRIQRPSLFDFAQKADPIVLGRLDSSPQQDPPLRDPDPFRTVDREFTRYLDALKRVDEDIKAADEWADKGEKLLADGQLMEAEQAYRNALKAHEFSEKAHYGLGRVFEATRKYDQAEEEYSIATILWPENKEIREALDRVKRIAR